MALWWIGNVILFVVVVPVLLGLLNFVLAASNASEERPTASSATAWG